MDAVAEQRLMGANMAPRQISANGGLPSVMSSMASLAAGVLQSTPAPPAGPPSHLCAGCNQPIKDRYLLQVFVAILDNTIPKYVANTCYVYVQVEFDNAIKITDRCC